MHLLSPLLEMVLCSTLVSFVFLLFCPASSSLSTPYSSNANLYSLSRCSLSFYTSYSSLIKSFLHLYFTTNSYHILLPFSILILIISFFFPSMKPMEFLENKSFMWDFLVGFYPFTLPLFTVSDFSSI